MTASPRVIFLTGAASGIGLHLAQRLARPENRLLLADLQQGRLAELAAQHGWPSDRVQCVELDVRKADQWERAIELATTTWGQIDVLLNVAGVVRPGYVHEGSPDDIDFHLDINARGTMIGTQAVARRMVAQRSGHIVNIASMAALAAVPGIALYSASKFAVRGFSLAVAQELRPHGVAVTCVCPDAVQTPMLDLQLDYPQAALTFSGRSPLTVEQVGDLIVNRVLVDRPLEAILPASRGLLAKLTSFWPATAARVLPRMLAVGRQHQLEAKSKFQARGADSNGSTP